MSISRASRFRARTNDCASRHVLQNVSMDLRRIKTALSKASSKVSSYFSYGLCGEWQPAIDIFKWPPAGLMPSSLFN